MKVLITSCPNNGHLFPMVPLAWALRNAGHQVLAAVPESVTGTATSAGLPTVDIGPVLLQGGHGDPRASQLEGTAALAEHVVEFYVPLAERTVERMLAVARAWGADVVVHPSWEYAGPLAAAVLGVPSIFHAWGIVPPPEVDVAAQRALAPLYRRYGLPDGLPPAPAWIDVCPERLREVAPAAGALPMSYVSYNGSAAVPDWLLEPRTSRRVCVTLGNIPIRGDHDSLAATTLAALAPLDTEIVVAAATRLRLPVDLPPRTRVVRNMPLSQLLPACDVVVHHGGAGSTFTTLSSGLSSLVLPQMCVQYQHAERIAAVGAGEYLPPTKATVDAIADAVASLLDTTAVAERAGELCRELAARPGPAAVASELTALLAPASTSVL